MAFNRHLGPLSTWHHLKGNSPEEVFPDHIGLVNSGSTPVCRVVCRCEFSREMFFSLCLIETGSHVAIYRWVALFPLQIHTKGVAILGQTLFRGLHLDSLFWVEPGTDNHFTVVCVTISTLQGKVDSSGAQAYASLVLWPLTIP